MPSAGQLIKFAADWLNFHGEKIKFVTSEFEGLSKVLEKILKAVPILPPTPPASVEQVEPKYKTKIKSEFKPEFKPLFGTNRVQLRPLSSLQASAFQVIYREM